MDFSKFDNLWCRVADPDPNISNKSDPSLEKRPGSETYKKYRIQNLQRINSYGSDPAKKTYPTLQKMPETDPTQQKRSVSDSTNNTGYKSGSFKKKRVRLLRKRILPYRKYRFRNLTRKFCNCPYCHPFVMFPDGIRFDLELICHLSMNFLWVELTRKANNKELSNGQP